MLGAFREAQRQCEDSYDSDPKRLTFPRTVLILGHNPQVSLLIYGEQFNGSNYIQIDGKAEVIP